MVSKNPNPQGKGLVPVLRDWGELLPDVPGNKAASEVLRDYCLSALVLAAGFRFKPVIGKAYFLYLVDGQWTLSLIAPAEWGWRQPGEFLAQCELRKDMTWRVCPTELDNQSTALASARAFVRSFVAELSTQDSISDNLPYYVSELPYYSRLLATALAASLKRSLVTTGDDLQAVLAAPHITGIPFSGVTESGILGKL